MHLNNRKLCRLVFLPALLAIGLWLAWIARNPNEPSQTDIHSGDSLPSQAPELVGGSARPVERRAPQAPGETEPLVSPLVISGTCVDEWGNAVGGGHVEARLQRSSLEYVIPDASTPVDEGGKFSFSMESSDVVSIRLCYRRGKSLHSNFSYVDIRQAKEEAASVKLVAYRTATLDVQVVDWRGSAVPHATVTARPRDVLLGGKVQCDERGHCTVRMLAEPHCALRAMSDGGAYGQTKALYLQPAERRRVRLRLDRELRRRAVRCVSNGGGLSGAHVRVRQLHERSWTDLVVDGEPGHINLPSTGRVTVVVNIVGIGTRQVRWKSINDAVTSGELVIGLENLGRMELTLVDQHGSALPNLRLELSHELPSGVSQRVQVKRTDSAGVLVVGPLAYGAYRARVSGHLDERLDLEASTLRQTLVMTGASTIHGTYTGPATVGGARVSLVVTSETGVVERIWVPSGGERARAWSVSVPMPPRTPFSVQAWFGDHQAGPPVSGAAPNAVLVDTTPHVLRVRARSGGRVSLRGWIEISPLDESNNYVSRTFIDPRDGIAYFPMPSPGAYRVRHSSRPMGGDGSWAAHVLQLKAGTATVDVDVAP